MGRQKNTESEPLIERLFVAAGGQTRLARKLGVADNYGTAWKKAGYIPEQWALDIEHLRLKDGQGQDITAYTVLYEAARVRRERIAEALRERT